MQSLDTLYMLVDKYATEIEKLNLDGDQREDGLRLIQRRVVLPVSMTRAGVVRAFPSLRSETWGIRLYWKRSVIHGVAMFAR
jgi:hypothetical protein